MAGRDTTAAGSALADREEELYVAITRSWFRGFTREERQEHPLDCYVLSPELMSSLQALGGHVELATVASVCARVAARYPYRDAGSHPARETLPAAQTRHEPMYSRYVLLQGMGHSLQLLYRMLGSGTIQFSTITLQNDTGRA
jgi:hypothetical protein